MEEGTTCRALGLQRLAPGSSLASYFTLIYRVNKSKVTVNFLRIFFLILLSDNTKKGNPWENSIAIYNYKCYLSLHFLLKAD